MIDIAAEIKKNPKLAIILIAALSAIAFFVYFSFILKPQVGRVFGALGRANSRKAELKRAEAAVARTDELKGKIEEYRKKVELYEKMLPTEEGIPDLLESLSNMAKDANMRIVALVPVAEKSRQDQTYREIPVMINAKSGYHELGRFFSALESSDRLMKVADIMIKSNKASPKRHDVEILVLTYTLVGNK